MSRWENASTKRKLTRPTGTFVDQYCASYTALPRAVTLDIDETVDVVHAHSNFLFWSGN